MLETFELTPVIVAPVPFPFPHQNRERSLLEVATLFKSEKPPVCGVQRWFDGCRLVIDDDGNCFGLSWMTTALIWAAQSPTRITGFIQQLMDPTNVGGAFRDLDSTSMVSSSGIRLPFSAAHVLIDTYLV